MNSSAKKNPENILKVDWENDADFLDDAIVQSVVSGLTVEPQAREKLLNSIYGAAKRKMMQALKYANDEQRNDITLADWKKVQQMQANKRELLSIEEKYDIIASQKPDMPMATNTGPCSRLMLPPWRHCKLGPTAVLKEKSRSRIAQAPPKRGAAPPKQPSSAIPATTRSCNVPWLQRHRQRVLVEPQHGSLLHRKLEI
ncbi:uncharacterized protein LOC111070209 [Drosophila obscura]|uniref:uncharacterized protein LOC111070209 n=1 Tax=Drosophila obscura TaxID=7282 RepID=UPI001BB1F741|nr:uncharacterized protein LOC111070209 [Drosophila obscura]